LNPQASDNDQYIRKIRTGVKIAHHILAELNQTVHQKKRFIGRTTAGFDFLGYSLCPTLKAQTISGEYHPFEDPCPPALEGELHPTGSGIT